MLKFVGNHDAPAVVSNNLHLAVFATGRIFFICRQAIFVCVGGKAWCNQTNMFFIMGQNQIEAGEEKTTNKQCQKKM